VVFGGAVSKRVNKARLISGVVKDSLLINIKRSSRKKRFFSQELEAIIVDMDGTVFRGDSSVEALNLKFPEKLGDTTTGEAIYRKLIQMVIEGRCTIDEVIVRGTNLLRGRGLCRGDFEVILEKVKPEIRSDLVFALRDVKRETGAKMVLATLSSLEFGEVLNGYLEREFGFCFDAVVGTRLEFNENGGGVRGVSEILGKKDSVVDGVRVKTKFTAVREVFEERGWGFAPERMVLITDGYGDIELIKKMVSILIRQSEPNLVQSVSTKLRLADFIVNDGVGLKDSIEGILLKKN
jgi:phosphoserine phosphatase